MCLKVIKNFILCQIHTVVRYKAPELRKSEWCVFGRFPIGKRQNEQWRQFRGVENVGNGSLGSLTQKQKDNHQTGHHHP